MLKTNEDLRLWEVRIQQTLGPQRVLFLPFCWSQICARGFSCPFSSQAEQLFLQDRSPDACTHHRAQPHRLSQICAFTSTPIKKISTYISINSVGQLLVFDWLRLNCAGGTCTHLQFLGANILPDLLNTSVIVKFLQYLCLAPYLVIGSDHGSLWMLVCSCLLALQ